MNKLHRSLFLLLALSIASTAVSKTIIITTNSAPEKQLGQVAPGDTALLAPGNHNRLYLEGLMATECDPTVVMSQDPGNPAVIYNPDTPGWATGKIQNCHYLILENVIFESGGPGLDIQLSHYVIVRDCEIRNTSRAGLKIRYRSSHIDFINNTIHNTGLVESGYGEGIYLGTAKAKGWEPWPTTAGGDANDTLSHIWIEGNEIYECGNGEGIDFKSDMKYVTVRGNHLHDLRPGIDYQTNEAAISIAGGRDIPSDEPAEFWIEDNVIENIRMTNYGNSHASGICTFGGGHYILNNTIRNCEEASINLHSGYIQYGLIPFFIYLDGNTITNDWGTAYKYDGGNDAVIAAATYYQDPGFTNPNTSQSWCGDVKSNCPTPDLGEPQSICGVGPIVLDANYPTDGTITFEWFKDGVSQGNASTSMNTMTVSEGGSWSVVIDSAGVCSNISVVEVSDAVGEIDLGPDTDFCPYSKLSFDVDLGVPGVAYVWERNGVEVSTTSVYDMEESGAYTVTASLAGCSDAQDEIVVTDGCAQTPFGGVPAAIPGIIEAEDYDEGGAEIAFSDVNGGNDGNAYRPDDVDIQTTNDSGGGHNVGWTSAGEWLEYTVDVAQSGKYTVSMRAASNNGGGPLQLEMDGEAISSEMAIPATGGWQNFDDFLEKGVELTAGTHLLRLNVIGGDVNINYMEFTFTEVITSTKRGHGETSRLYPNPTSGPLTSTMEGPYEILTAQGHALEIQDELDLSHLQSGLYLVKFADGTLQKVLKK